MPQTTLTDRENFNAVIDLLVLYTGMGDSNELSALVKSALYGCSVLEQINWSGSSTTFATNLVDRLVRFGECEPGRPTIVLLLEDLKTKFGFDKQSQIDTLIQVYTPQIFKEEITSQFQDTSAQLDKEQAYNAKIA